jgi:hypothetical protein
LVGASYTGFDRELRRPDAVVKREALTGSEIDQQ